MNDCEWMVASENMPDFSIDLLLKAIFLLATF